MKRVFAIIFLIIAVCAVYLLLYIMPSVKAISRYKRRLKDMELKITDFGTMEKAFVFSTEREKNYFSRSQEELKNKIPVVKSGEDFNELFTKISAYIETLAEEDGISGPVLEPMPGAGPPSPLLSLLDGIRYQTVSLRFRGELKGALNFINHIPWSNYYLAEDKISISAAGGFPGYRIFLKLYYVDLRPENERSKAGGKSAGGLIIDYHSEILLRPVQPGIVEKRLKKELPPRFGKSFCGGPGASRREEPIK